MSGIVMSDVKELTDPKVRKIAMRVAKTFYLAAEKAVAHSVDASAYPMPSNPNAPEQIFASRFKELPQLKKSAAISRVMSFIKGPKENRVRLYGDLAQIDLGVDTEIRQQVKALPFPQKLRFPKTHLETLIHPISNVLYSGGVPQSLIINDKLECRIHKVVCVDETNSFWEPEWIGSDEILLGGSSIDATGVTKKIEAFDVGSFDDGSVKEYPARKTFTIFNLLAGTEWPKSYFVIFALAEEDMGGFSNFLNALVDSVRDEVVTALSTAIGSAIGASGGPIGAIIGAAVGFAVGKIIEWLKSWWSDEVFDPVTVALQIPSLEYRWNEGSPVSPEEVIEFRGHNGHYQLTYDWRLYGTEAQHFRSFESFNYPEHFIRHRNYRGELTTIESALDRKDSTFKIVKGLSGKGVSFESLNFPGYYLRHKNFEIWLERKADDELFKQDSSFILHFPGLVGGWGGYFCISFESLNYPGHYIRHRNFKLYLEKGEDESFRKDASFMMRDGRWWAVGEEAEVRAPTAVGGGSLYEPRPPRHIK